MSDVPELPVPASTSGVVQPETLGISAHVGRIVAGWREAWQTRGDNPLCAAWELAERRNRARLPWWKRDLSLTIAGVALVLTGVYLTLLAFTWFTEYFDIQHDYLRLLVADYPVDQFISSLCNLFAGPDWFDGPALRVVPLLVGIVAAACYGVYSLLWLVVRLYEQLVLAFGFMEREARHRLRRTLDDLIAVTPLTEQELVLGCFQYILRRLLVPLFSVSLAAAAISCVWFDLERSDRSSWLWNAAPPGDHLAELRMLWAALSVAFFVGALLYVASMVCCALALSLAPRSGLWPGIGAATLILAQPLLVVAYHYLVPPVRPLSAEEWADSSPIGPLWICGWLVIGAVGLALYLARRWAWMRVVCTVALPLVMLLPVALGLAPLLFDSSDAQVVGLWATAESPALELPALFDPPQLMLYSRYQDATDYAQVTLASLGHCLWLLPLQLALLLVAAEFARDAVRRRKWGAA